MKKTNSPGAIIRIAAIGIDFLLWMVIYALFVFLLVVSFKMRMIEKESISALIGTPVIPIVFFVLLFMYFVVFDAVFGGTVGKKVLRIELVSTDNKKLSILKCLFRTILFFLLSPLFGVCFIPYIFSRDGECLHDRIASTAIIFKTSESKK